MVFGLWFGRLKMSLYSIITRSKSLVRQYQDGLEDAISRDMRKWLDEHEDELRYRECCDAIPVHSDSPELISLKRWHCQRVDEIVSKIQSGMIKWGYGVRTRRDVITDYDNKWLKKYAELAGYKF
jgi:hypothetical protein